MIRIIGRTLAARWAGLVGSAVALTMGVALAAAAGLILVSTLDQPDRAPRWYVAPEVVVAGPAVAGTSTADPGGGFGSPPLTPDERGYLPSASAPAVSTVSGAARIVVDRAGYARFADVTEAHPWSAADLRPYEFVAGRPPVADDEVVVTTGNDVGLGERISVDTAEGRQSFIVSGTLRVEGPPALYVTETAAARLARDRITAIAVFAAPGISADVLAARVRAALVDQPQLRVLTGADRRLAEPDPDAGLLIATSVLVGDAAGVAAFVSAFVVAGTFAFAVNQRRRELALLRIAGATPRQIRRLVRGEALGVGALSGLVGCALGAVIAQPCSRWLARVGLAPPDFSSRFTLWPLAAAYLLGMVLALAGASSAARRAGRIGPMEALRTEAVARRAMTWARWVSGLAAIVGAAAVVPLLRTPEGVAYLLLVAMLLIAAATLLAPAAAPALVRLLSANARGPAGLLARDSALASPRRTASTATPVLITIGLAGASLVGTATISAAQAQSVREHVTAPVVVVAADGSAISDRIAVAASRVAGVTAAVTVKQTMVYDRVDGSVRQRPTWYVDATNAGAALRLPVTSGSLADLTGDSVAMADSVADAHGWVPGDQVGLWLGDGAAVQLRLVATTADRLGLPAVLLSWTIAATHSARPMPDAVYLALAPGADRALIEATVRPMGGELLATGTYLSVLDAEFDRLNRLALLAIVGLALLYTAISIANTALMSSAARGPEFTALRRCGATTGQLRRIVAREALLASAIGVLLGLAVTVAALAAVTVALSPVVGLMPIVIPWTALTPIIATCVVLATVAAIVPTGTVGMRHQR